MLKELKIQNIKNKFEAEEQAANQNYEVTMSFTFLLLNCNRSCIHVNLALVFKVADSTVPETYMGYISFGLMVCSHCLTPKLHRDGRQHRFTSASVLTYLSRCAAV